MPADDDEGPVVPPLPPSAYEPPSSTPSPSGSGGYGDPTTRFPDAPGGYPGAAPANPYQAGPYSQVPGAQPYPASPMAPDNRPGVWWGVIAGAVIVALCVLFVGLNSGMRFGADAWFVGVTIAFAIVPLAAIATVIPLYTRKIGQGLFIVLGALPLIWFGVCVQALTAAH